MSTQGRAIVDKLLTDISNKIVPHGYLSEEILPMKPVVQDSGLIGSYGNDHLRIVNTVSGGKQGYPMVESDVRSSTSYLIETHGLKEIITKKDFRNVEKPFDAERDAVNKLTTHLWLGKEKSLADALTSTATITQNVTLSGTSQYNDFTNSDPIGDAITAIGTIEDATGEEANILIMDSKTLRTLRYHPALLDSLGFKESRPGGLSVEEMARAFDVERVLVGRAKFNSAAKGQTDVIANVWGKNMIFAVSPKSAGLEQISLGYRLQIAGQKPRQVQKTQLDEPMGAKKIIVEDEYDQVLVNVNAAFLIKDSIL